MKRHSKKNRQPLIFRIYKYIAIIIIALLVINYIYSNTSLFYNRRIILPFSFHLSKSKLYLLVGEEYRLFAFGDKERVEFASTNFNIAEVNFAGIVKAYRPGKTYIIAKSGDKQFRCLVHVIDINKKKLTLSVGKSYRLRVRGIIAPGSYKSSDKRVAAVNMFGRVKAKGKGRATIYAKVKGKVLRTEIVVN